MRFGSKKKWQTLSLKDVIDEVLVGLLPKISDQMTGTTPIIKSGDIIRQKSPYIHECKTFLNDRNIRLKKSVQFEDLIMLFQSSLKSVGKTFVYVGNEKSLLGANLAILRHCQNPRYLCHILNSPKIQRQIKDIGRVKSLSWTLASVPFKYIRDIEIPVPPLNIQEKIANYLDKLLMENLQLQDSLEKMLGLRKKQYAIYRERVLGEEMDKWEVRTIKEIATDIYVGGRVNREHLGTGDYPAAKCGDVNSKLGLYFTECVSFVDPKLIVGRKKYFEYGDILMGVTSHSKATSGTATAYLGKRKCLAGNMVYVIKHRENPKFLSYALSSKYCRRQIEEKSVSGVVVSLFIKELRQIQIPLPPLDVQEKIVERMEKLDMQMSKLERGIEELIENRNKQFQCLTDQIIG